MTRACSDRDLTGRLGRMFDQMTSGPIPEHLLALVDQLEAARLENQSREVQLPIPIGA